MMNPRGGVQEFPGADFLPSDLPDLQLWLEMLLAEADIHGSRYDRAWTDLSLQGNDFDELADTDDQPLYQDGSDGTFGTAPSLKFDGDDDYIKCASLSGSGTDHTFYFVLHQVDAGAGTRYLYGQTPPTLGLTGEANYGVYDGAARTFGSTNFGSAGILRIVCNATTGKCNGYWNGTASGSQRDYTPVAWGGKGIIGTAWTETTTFCIEGWIAAVLRYAAAHTSAQAGLVETYLAGRYGITL